MIDGLILKPRLTERRMRIGLAACIAVVAISGLAGQARAADYPSDTVRIMIPWNAGGPNDLIARALAEKMSEATKHRFIIENRPGANGITGSNVVAKAKPDGYTVLLTSSAHALNAAMYETLPFDPVKDFEAVTLIALTSGNVFVVRADSPIKNLKDFIEQARQAPGKFAYATNGLGNGSHISGELLAREAKIDITPVHYRGTAPFVTDVLGGHVPAGFMSPVAAVPLIASGKMRALALAGAERTKAMPDVPTFAELGYPKVQVIAYYAVWAPAGTPKDRVNTLQKLIVSAMKSEEFVRIARDSDLAVKGSTPEAFAAFLVDDIAKMKALMKAIDFKPIK